MLTGHEGSTFIISTALNVAGPPLGRFIERAMADLASRERGRVARWKQFREEQTAKNGGHLSPSDTRRLMRELRYHWSGLSRYFQDSPQKEKLAKDLRDTLNDDDSAKGDAFFFTINSAQHQDAEPITLRATHRVLVALVRTMLLIGARAEADYLFQLSKSIRASVEAGARKATKPALRKAPAGTTCVGAHWVQPKMGIPGHWWWVAVRDDRIARIDVDLTTAEVADELARLTGPTLAGLAFCFSAPAHYVLREDIGSVEHLWQRCRPFSHKTAKETVQEMGSPFRLVGHGEPMRKPKADPSAFRETEIDVWQRTGAEPSSIFDVDGTDSVGALALNGIPIIRDMREAGAAIWPFDRPAADGLTCVEIFPRSLWGSLNPSDDPRSKKNLARREAFIEQSRDEGLSLNQRDAKTLIDDERAFDAFVTARALSMYGGGLTALETLPLSHIEGQIWIPG
jgi:hypothetical protein